MLLEISLFWLFVSIPWQRWSQVSNIFSAIRFPYFCPYLARPRGFVWTFLHTFTLPLIPLECRTVPRGSYWELKGFWNRKRPRFEFLFNLGQQKPIPTMDRFCHSWCMYPRPGLFVTDISKTYVSLAKNVMSTTLMENQATKTNWGVV